jgi:hypothetical protein
VQVVFQHEGSSYAVTGNNWETLAGTRWLYEDVWMGNIYRGTKYTRVHDLGWMIDFSLGTSRRLVIALRKGITQGAVRTIKTVSCATRLLAAASYCQHQVTPKVVHGKA